MVTIKSSRELAHMAEGGRRLGYILKVLSAEARPGVTTKYLDERSEYLIRSYGDIPAFLHYTAHGDAAPYPATLCASVNDGIVHGLPSARKLEEGDVLKLDLGLVHKGLYLDAAVTVLIGTYEGRAVKLLAATKDALSAGIEAAHPGNTVGDIGAAISKEAAKKGFKVVDALTGHGIGRSLHEDPTVFNEGKEGAGEKLVPGMVLAIEPMVSAGSSRVKHLKDNSFVTADGSLAAHFEHTVAITDRGPRVLTR